MSQHPDLDFKGIIQHLHDGLYVVDPSRRILHWNAAAERITGFTAAEVVGRSCADNVLMHVDAAGTALCEHGCPLTSSMQYGKPEQAAVYLRHKSGHRLPVCVRVSPLVEQDGAVRGAVELFADNSSVEALRTKVETLEQLSLIDPLTQLPNRRWIGSELEAQLALFRRTGAAFGVILLDVDHFKQFNDEHGHDVGDLALQILARTCASVVRPFDTIGRWGGEEFVGVFPNADAQQVETIAVRLCNMIRHSRVAHAGRSLNITVSVGATCARSGDTLGSIVRRADTLMYTSKRAGRDRVTADPPAYAA